MMEIDETDTRILRVLERDGRISNSDLAKRVNLSASACLRRVQELERTGVIVGYRAILNREAMGVGFIAYVTVGLSEHTKKAQADFERAMSTAPQVRECYNVTGSIEYLLRVEAADLAAYKHFHTEILGNTPKVQSITSLIIMDTSKNDRG